MYILTKASTSMVNFKSTTIIRSMCFKAKNPVAKPLMLLDVDGVLNILEDPIWNDTKKCKALNEGPNKGYYPINYSPKMINEINQLSRADMIEVQWLTTWDKCARKDLAKKIGIDDFQLARDPVLKLPKEVAAVRRAEEYPERPIIWVDDHLRYFELDVDFWSKRKSVLFVCTERLQQLTPQDIETIKHFAKDPKSNNVKEVLLKPRHTYTIV